MKRYESYKDSGVKWLGEIPGHWEVLPLKYIFKLQKKLVGRNSNKYKLLSLTLQGIKVRDLENPTGKFPSSFDSYQIVEPGDFIFCNFDNEETPRAVGQSKFKGMITGAYDVFGVNNNNMDSNYLLYYCLYIDDAKRFKPLYKGLRKTIPFDSFMSYKIAIPPKAEQTAIANYLDSVTSKIDKAISQQQKMIDLLNERKQIIIQNAVTKGLDPNAKMKDSGVEWIGEIPEDWEVLKLRRISKIFTGKTPSTSNPRYFHSEDIEWFTPGDFNGIELKSSKRKISNYAIKDNASILYPKHSIFIIGIGGTIGKVAFCDLEASCNQQINVIILNENANYRYITYLLQNSNSEIMKNANLSTLPIINQQKTGDLKIILPNINEQSLIVDYINNEIKPIDSSISQCNKMISLLQERKQIIINDVVTGKVKVI